MKNKIDPKVEAFKHQIKSALVDREGRTIDMDAQLYNENLKSMDMLSLIYELSTEQKVQAEQYMRNLLTKKTHE